MGRLNSPVLCAFGSVFLFGCGGGGSPTSTGGGGPVAAPAPTPSPSPSPTPAPTPPPATPAGSIVGGNIEDGFPQLDKISTNFSVAELLMPSWGTGDIAPSAGGDPIGAFRFMCKPSHLAYDDPIVFPGQKGRAHLHQFFGNTLANGDSTYESLRTSGASTCTNALNRSAYWIPAMLNGRGQVVQPDEITIYYKRYPDSHPKCREGKGCISLPRGLRFVFGRNMNGGDRYQTWFNCSGPGAVSGIFDTFAEAAKNCPTGASIAALAEAPPCWNGTQLDSPDHRSHMAHESWDSGQPVCPATHPYRVPTFLLAAWYPTDDTLDRSGSTSPDVQTWHFSSDRMPGMPRMASGETFHADWFGAWDDNTLAAWVSNCINKHLSCTGGDLGNGSQLRSSPEFLTEVPRLVPVPADPKG